MAETALPNGPIHSGPPADFAEHEHTYHGVMHLARWFIGHMALLLSGLYFIVLGGAGVFGAFLILVSVVVLAYGVISTPAAAEHGGDEALAHEDANGYRVPSAD